MNRQRKQTYQVLSSVLVCGYVWIFIHYINILNVTTFGCLIKKITGIPCPSCGSTRSVLEILQGNFSTAFYLNPLGYLILCIAVLFPIGLIYDLGFKQKRFFQFYNNLELFIKQRTIAIPLIGIVIVNWMWNIIKGV